MEREQEVELLKDSSMMFIGDKSRVELLKNIMNKNKRGITMFSPDNLEDAHPVKCRYTLNSSHADDLTFLVRATEAAIVENDAGVLNPSLCVRATISQFKKLGGNIITGFKISSIEKNISGFKKRSTIFVWQILRHKTRSWYFQYQNDQFV